MRYKVIKKLQYDDIVLGEVGDVVDVNLPTRSITNYKTGAYATYISDEGLKKAISDSLIPYVENDNVNHPKHYTSHPSGIECIEITRHYCFSIGNAIKYLWRAGLKKELGLEDKQKEIEDLEKAKWYIEDRIKQLKDGIDKTRT